MPRNIALTSVSKTPPKKVTYPALRSLVHSIAAWTSASVVLNDTVFGMEERQSIRPDWCFPIHRQRPIVDRRVSRQSAYDESEAAHKR